MISLHVAVAGSINEFRREGKLAIVEDAHHHAGASLLLGAAAFYGKFHRVPSSAVSAFCCRLAICRALSANSSEKVKTFPYVMIFRRSLVRELTATTIGLFVVLLAILFTQSVIRSSGAPRAAPSPPTGFWP
jgi:hypothetical protein